MQDWRATYERDGAAVLRNVLPKPWIQRMAAAVDRVISAPSSSAIEYTDQDQRGRYVGDFFLWTRDQDFRALALESPLPSIAAEIMGCDRITLFYDHLLVKEPHTAEHTPWHQDLPYWPLQGSQILSLWVPFDPVSPETGAVVYLRGSHRNEELYAPAVFSEKSGFAEIYQRAGLKPVPGDLAETADDDLLVWSTEPGDVIVHQPRVLHYSPGNSSAHQRRRAVALRYLGDDAAYCSRPGNFLEKKSIRRILPAPLSYQEGERLGPPLFPVINVQRPTVVEEPAQ